MAFPGRFRVYMPSEQKWVVFGRQGNGDYIWPLLTPDIISWSTGLFDKNGKEIFEGDIVEWDDESDGRYWRVAVVGFDPDICFEIVENTKHPLSIEAGYRFHFGCFSYSDTQNHLVIIGNIYENLNLLKTDPAVAEMVEKKGKDGKD